MSPTFTSLLSDRIWCSEEFQNNLRDLHSASVLSYLECRVDDPGVTVEVAHRLLQAAFHLSNSTNLDHHAAAYRIAIGVLRIFDLDLPNLPNVLHVLFGKLGNFPAIDHLYRCREQPKQYVIPSGTLHELLFHEGSNTVIVGERDVLLTDFQRNLWGALALENAVSLSAPTSAGKSFVLQNYLAQGLLSEELNMVLYLVPTRALINQVSDAISGALGRPEDEIVVSSIPQTPAELMMERGVYVLTQERAHVLLAAAPDITFDLVIVDEAQTIGSGARGILLQSVIEHLLTKRPDTRFFFGSPFARNPEHFDYLLSSPPKSVLERSSPVAQNLILVDVDPLAPQRIHISLDTGSEPIPLTDIDLPIAAHGDESIFAASALRLGRNGKSLVYVGSPAKCEAIADKIRQLEDIDEGTQSNCELMELSQLIRDHIHPKYELAKMVERGIAFHYGKMPTILRKAIEHYFATCDQLRFLVCTSTLLHGVNLPARNLFILKPSEGAKWLANNAEPMKSTSFWNLAGRAGRLGKDFEGNVFLVNKAQWAEDPTKGEKEQTIKSSFYEVIRDRHQEMLAMTAEFAVRVDQEIESAFTKLYTDYRADRLTRVLLKSPVGLPPELQNKLEEKFKELSFSVPDWIIEANVSISPFRQQRMLEYMLEAVKNGDHAKLIPVHPLNSGSYTSYVRLFSRYELCFDGRTRATRMPRRLATIALHWMRGTPYPRIIQDSQKAAPDKGLQSVIRETMETIENDLRFKAVQRTRCYIDLLCYVLEKHELGHLVASIPAMSLYLELGACSGTMVTLVGMGLSRTTAGLLNEKAANKGMERIECVRWLRRERWESSDLPKFCIREVMSVIGAL